MVNLPKLCAQCGLPFVPTRSDKITCSKACRINRDAALRRAHPDAYARKLELVGATAERFTSREIFERDGWKCGLCGKSVAKARTFPDPLSPSLDHVVPISKGGDHTRANVQIAHLGCNLAKRDRAAGEQLRLIG